jgi:hypothetical protein
MALVLGAGLALAASVAPAFAAMCFTTDDGQYPCTFEGIQGDGSFVISAKGKPTFTLYVIGNGVGDAYGVFEPGGRSVNLPGPYLRSRADPACWVSSATDTQICAW